MTNTKFRRRALVSSLAMLLVALVALGSATFAWFTSNPVATADGISAKGETSTGLVIHTDTDPNPTNTHAAKFMKTGTTTGDLVLLPAFLKDSSTLLTTSAKSSDNYKHDETDTSVKWDNITLTNASSYVPAEGSTPETKVTLSGNAYKETAYLNTTGKGTTLTDIKLDSLTISATQTADRAIKDGVCVAVYAGTTPTLIGIWKVGTDPIKTYTTTPAYDQTVGTEASGTTAVKANGSGHSTAIGQASDSTALPVSVIVYLDGTDSKVKTDNARAAELISGIELKFSC